MIEKEVILGVDEVGRGSLAGPVVAAAVVLFEGRENILIKDSKKIPKNKINAIANKIKKCSFYAIGQASVAEINRLNILGATMLAMRRAIAGIDQNYHLVRIDGNQNPFKDLMEFEKSIELLINGDAICRSIAAASIIAKSYRDNLMRELHQQYPSYYWHENKGYSTKKHIEAIREHGISNLHRELFCKKFVKL
ncbi:MAG: ribonuclease HII [Candidatus Midichloria sp.]|nr:MAG: ribonuclease HII [Candidatus Midichloria sp.]